MIREEQAETRRVIKAFTVDLEDWFQGLTSTNARPDEWDDHEPRVEQHACRLLRLLADCDVHATFFVLDHVAERYHGLIVEVESAGHEIGVHGYWYRTAHRLTPQALTAELDRALDLRAGDRLAPAIGQPRCRRHLAQRRLGRPLSVDGLRQVAAAEHHYYPARWLHRRQERAGSTARGDCPPAGQRRAVGRDPAWTRLLAARERFRSDHGLSGTGTGARPGSFLTK